MAMQLDSMQTDINSLKELMQNEGLTLDVNTLMDVSKTIFSYSLQ